MSTFKEQIRYYKHLAEQPAVKPTRINFMSLSLNMTQVFVLLGLILSFGGSIIASVLWINDLDRDVIELTREYHRTIQLLNKTDATFLSNLDALTAKQAESLIQTNGIENIVSQHYFTLMRIKDQSDANAKLINKLKEKVNTLILKNPQLEKD